VKKLILLILLFSTTASYALNICKKEWQNEHINRNCHISYMESGELKVIEAGVFEKKCTSSEGAKSADCMIVRTCGFQSDNITSAPLHNIPRHLNSLCLTSKPRKVLRIDSKTYVEFSCQGNKVSMVFVAGSKRKTCPLPFKMP
jgi:hypothetical protein